MTTTSGFPFPPSPQIGDIHNTPTKSYTWNGFSWVIRSSQTTATSIVSPSGSFNSTTNSVSTTTGALVIAGGVGIGGDVHVGGMIYANGVPFITTASFNISDGPDGGTDINIQHYTDILTGTSTILINNISTLETVTGRGNTTPYAITITNATSSTDVNSGALIVAGGIGIAGRVNTESIQIADTIFDSTYTFVPNNNASERTIDSYYLSQYRSSKYFIQISESTSSFHICEITLTAKNDGTTYMTQYGQVTTDGELGTFDAKGEVSGNTYLISLTFTPKNTGLYKTIKVLRTAMTV